MSKRRIYSKKAEEEFHIKIETLIVLDEAIKSDEKELEELESQIALEDEKLKLSEDIAIEENLQLGSKHDKLTQLYNKKHYQLMTSIAEINILTAETKALAEKYPEIINTLDSNGSTALMTVAFVGNKSLATDLLELGADPNIQDKYGQTALHYLATSPYDIGSDLPNSASDLEATAQILIDHHASPDIQDESGNAPLYYLSEDILEINAPNTPGLEKVACILRTQSKDYNNTDTVSITSSISIRSSSDSIAKEIEEDTEEFHDTRTSFIPESRDSRRYDEKAILDMISAKDKTALEKIGKNITEFYTKPPTVILGVPAKDKVTDSRAKSAIDPIKTRTVRGPSRARGS